MGFSDERRSDSSSHPVNGTPARKRAFSSEECETKPHQYRRHFTELMFDK